MIPNLDACALSVQHIKLLLLLLDPHLAVNRPKAAPARALFAALTAAAVPARSHIPPHRGGCARQAVPGWGNNQGPFCTPRAGQLSLAPAGAGRSTHHSSFNEMLKLHPANTLHAWYFLNFIFALYLAALSSPDRASLPPCCSISSSSISKPLVLAGVAGLYPHPAGCILVCYPRCRPWPSLLPLWCLAKRASFCLEAMGRCYLSLCADFGSGQPTNAQPRRRLCQESVAGCLQLSVWKEIRAGMPSGRCRHQATSRSCIPLGGRQGCGAQHPSPCEYN